jgi:hypothetical protein
LQIKILGWSLVWKISSLIYFRELSKFFNKKITEACMPHFHPLEKLELALYSALSFDTALLRL